MSRKAIAVFLAFLLMLSAACSTVEESGTETTGQETEKPAETQNNEGEEGGSGEDAGDQGSEDAAEESPSTIPTEKMSFQTGMTAFNITRDMKIGWNLGNTFDGPSETEWVGIATTKEMIDDIKEAGFNTLRLPVTWSNPKNGGATADNDYTISETFMDRIEEVAGYALANNMFVIINSHHDAWVSSVISEGSDVAMQRIWEQISERFKYYNEKVVFETMNEPRRTGDDWGGDEESRNKINELNKIAVDTIRASGENNEYRFIMVPGYAAAADYSTLSSLEIPNGDKRIIASVHSYTPGSLCFPGPQTEWGSDEDILTIKIMFDNINELLIKKGIPVVIGEFGTVNKDNEEQRALWAKYYIALAAQYRIPCIWWDNNIFGLSVSEGAGENFGLYHRNSREFRYPLVLEALMEGLQWEPELPENKLAEVMLEYQFESGDSGITVEIDEANGTTWMAGVAQYEHAVLDGVGAIRVNASYHGGWEITKFNIPEADIPSITGANKLRYTILMPKTAEALISWTQLSTCFSTSLEGWIQSGVTSGLSAVSFNDDYFLVRMEEDLTSFIDKIEGAETVQFMWINYGFVFEGPIYLMDVQFVKD